MSEPYTRQLTFKSDNLGVFTTLLLVFDKDVDGLFHTRFPVVWRSSEFQSDGVSMVSVTYQNRPAFLKPGPLVHDTIVDIATSQALDPTQETTLLVDEVGIFSFTNPQTFGPTDDVMVVNGTSKDESVAFGFGQLDPNQPPTPMYYWHSGDFKASSSIQTQLNSVLRAYISSEYRDAQVLKAPIQYPVIFEQDLSLLPKSTTWILTYDHATGQYKITRELA